MVETWGTLGSAASTGDRAESASSWAQSSEPPEGAGGGAHWAEEEEHSAEPADSVWGLRALSQGGWIRVPQTTAASLLKFTLPDCGCCPSPGSFPATKSSFFLSCRHFRGCPHIHKRRTGLESAWSPSWPQGPLWGPSVMWWSRYRKRCRNYQKAVSLPSCHEDT